jgi:hypothetical protein
MTRWGRLKSMKKQSLLKQPYKFAVVGGIFWGLTLFFATILAMITGFGRPFLELVGGIYPKYEISFSGSLAGLILGFIDGFLICYVFAFIAGKQNKRKPKNKV